MASRWYHGSNHALIDPDLEQQLPPPPPRVGRLTVTLLLQMAIDIVP